MNTYRHFLAVLLLPLGLWLGTLAASAASLPNAWQIADDSGSLGGLFYTNTLTAAQKIAATNQGWHFTVVSRMVQGSGGGGPAQFMSYGHGNRRFVVGWDVDAAGQLTVKLYGGTNPVVNLTGAGAAATNYHRHELVYHAGTTVATYLFDGAPILTWPGLAPDTAYNGQAFWGSAAGPGQGRMSYHHVQFAISGLGTVSAYNAGVAGRPVTAPSPTNQAWTMSWGVPTSTVLTNFPVSPDGVVVPPSVLPGVVVANTNDNGAGSLRQALLDVAPGGTITFDPTLNGRTVVLTSGELIIGKNMNIVGPGPGQLAISGNGNSRGFSINSGVTSLLAGLTVTGGKTMTGSFPSGAGGGILNNGGFLTISNCTVSGNTAVAGGGIYASDNGMTATLTVQNSTVSNNAASSGGGIAVSCIARLDNCTVNGNSAEGTGGGIHNNYSGFLTLNHCTVSGNGARFGGGIYNEVYVVDVFPPTATVMLFNSTLANNSGGQVSTYARGGNTTVTISNCTFSVSAPDLEGGGISNWGYSGRAALTVCHCTFSGHTGFGIYSTDLPSGTASLNIGHTLLSRGQGGTNFFNEGSVINLGFNLSDDNTTSAFATTREDLLLDPVANNGGPTLTHALRPGSPAIDAGTNNAITGLPYDQRGPGYPRLVADRMDIGAYESCTTNYTVTSLSDGGPGSLRDAIACIAPGGTITFDPYLNYQTILLTNGELVINRDLTILGPGPDKLLLDGYDGSGLNRIFRVANNSPPIQVVLSGLAMTNGSARSFNDNVTDEYGGGIYNDHASLMVSNCSITSCTAADSGKGGGIANDHGVLVVANSSLSLNRAFYGGGIANLSGTLTVLNSTLSGNSAFQSCCAPAAIGGGIYNNGSGNITLLNSTLAGNGAMVKGGAFYNDSLNVVINVRNSILAGNFLNAQFGVGGADLWSSGSALLSNGRNFIGTTNGIVNPTVFTDKTFANTGTTLGQLLATNSLGRPWLADNGGPTPTITLMSGSAAIDAGLNSDATGLAYDQRGPGFARQYGSAVDIGAYEVHAFNGVPLAGLSRVGGGTVAWGDYDNDGRLDFLITAASNYFDGPMTQLLHNTGSGFEHVSVPGLPGLFNAAIAWGDYNNDGWLDFLITGARYRSEFVGNDSGMCQLWRNNGGTGFTQVPLPGVPGVYNGSIAWGDYDNDGRLDFIVTGETNDITRGKFVSQLWHNTGDGFSYVPIPDLPGVGNGSVAWIDYDNDGLLDFSINGNDDHGVPCVGVCQLWRNTGNGFINQPIPGLQEAVSGSMVWCDYDNDGRLDFLLTGLRCLDDSISSVALWRNTGTGFELIPTPGLAGAYEGSAAWGDYDNDGRPDLLLSGYSGDNDAPGGFGIWRNTGSSFVKGPATGVEQVIGTAAWGDYDNDGRLDILINGLEWDFEAGLNTRSVQLLRNSAPSGNSPPTAPTGLIAQVHPNSLTLSWLPASDDHTPRSGLSYNVVLSTTPGGVDLASPLANPATGFRRVVQLGAANQRTSWTFTNLPAAPIYYWSVQAVDGAYAGGAFAPMESVPNVVFTSMAKPGSNRATLAFTGTTGHLYTVERSDNLVTWAVAGTATENPAGSGQFIFSDNTATGSKRFYRLRY